MPDRVTDLHRDALIFVAHDHRPIGPDIPLMRRGGVTAKVFQVTLDVDPRVGLAACSDRMDCWSALAERQLDETLATIAAAREACVLARRAEDVVRAKRDDKVAVVLGTEGTRWLGESLDPLYAWHERGLRELQLRWAFRNAVVPHTRLSEFGRLVVRACNDIGIVVDLTHLPTEAFHDVIGVTTKPVIVSHGSTAALTTDLSDAQIRALASTGGVLGVHFFTSYLGPNPSPTGVARQVRYVADLVGIDHVALGVDFFPTDADWTRLVHDTNTPELRWAIDDLSQMWRITEALVGIGLSDDDVRKVLGGNLLRVYREVI